MVLYLLLLMLMFMQMEKKSSSILKKSPPKNKPQIWLNRQRYSHRPFNEFFPGKHKQGAITLHKILQQNCLEKTTNISHKMSTVHSCQPFQPLLYSQKLPIMKTDPSQSYCYINYYTVETRSLAFKISLTRFSCAMYFYVNYQKQKSILKHNKK